MDDSQRAVEEFMTVMGQQIPSSPTLPDAETQELRVKLIEEELQELRDAFAAGDLVEAYDAAVDLKYVVEGLFGALGADGEPGFWEVQRSNMSKLGADGKPIISRGEELDGFPRGKVLKGPNYFKPNLRLILEEQGMVRDA